LYKNKNIRTNQRVFSKLKGVIEKTGVNIKCMPKIIMTKMVVTKKMSTKLNLNKLAMNLDNVEFEPEQFPALIYKIR